MCATGLLNPSALLKLFSSAISRFFADIWMRFSSPFPSFSLIFLSFSPSLFFASKGRNVIGNCTEWEHYQDAGAVLALDFLFYDSLAVESEYEVGVDKTVVHLSASCHDKTVVHAFARAVIDSRSYDGECNGHTWRVVACGWATAVCVDCKFACSRCAGASFLVHPCRDCRNERTDAFSVLRLSIAERVFYPRFIPISTHDRLSATVAPEEGDFQMYSATLFVPDLNRTQTSFLVAFRVDAGGQVSCGAFEVENKEHLNNPASLFSYAAILLQGVSTTVSNSTSAGPAGTVHTLVYLNLSGLIPDADYRIYCFAESFIGQRMPSDIVIAQSLVVRTRCCRAVRFDLPIPTEIYTYRSSSDPPSVSRVEPVFRFRVDKPKGNFTLQLDVTGCLSYYPGGAPKNPTIAPTKFYFDSKVPIFEGRFLARGEVPECFRVNFKQIDGLQWDNFQEAYYSFNM